MGEDWKAEAASCGTTVQMIEELAQMALPCPLSIPAQPGHTHP